MAWQGYILVGELVPGWQKGQRTLVHDKMRGLGKQNDPMPAKNNHSRTSLDGTKLLFEGEFEEGEISRKTVVAEVATLLGVNETAVNAKMSYTIFGEGESLQTSRHLAHDHITANIVDWQENL